jgi:hypothetical protein
MAPSYIIPRVLPFIFVMSHLTLDIWLVFCLLVLVTILFTGNISCIAHLSLKCHCLSQPSFLSIFDILRHGVTDGYIIDFGVFCSSVIPDFDSAQCKRNMQVFCFLSGLTIFATSVLYPSMTSDCSLSILSCCVFYE